MNRPMGGKPGAHQRAVGFTWLSCHKFEHNQIRAEVVRHARHVTFQIAEVAMPRQLFAAILDRFQRFGVRPPP